jgi:hypothetical protein
MPEPAQLELNAESPPVGDAVSPADLAPPEPAPPPAPPEPAPQPAPPCRNAFGLLCGSPPPPRRPAAPRLPPTPETEPVPVASPAAVGGPSEAAPRPGSNLDAALRSANMASDQFNRSLEEPTGSEQTGR